MNNGMIYIQIKSHNGVTRVQGFEIFIIYPCLGVFLAGSRTKAIANRIGNGVEFPRMYGKIQVHNRVTAAIRLVEFFINT